MIKRLVATVFAMFFLTLFSASFAAENEPVKQLDEEGESPRVSTKDKGGISMNFSGTDIAVLIKYVSEMTGKNFVVDGKVQGKVTILSPKKVSKEEAYKVFESILAVYGFSAVPAGDVIKIVPTTDAKTLGGATMDKSTPLSPSVRDQMVTRLIPLIYITADNMVNTLRPLVSPSSYIAPYQPSNTIIVVDQSSNVERLLSIIEKLDVEGRETTMTFLPLKYATVKDIAAKITSLLGQQPGKPQLPQSEAGNMVLAEDRLNSLIVVGNEAYLKKVKLIVAQLDVEPPPGRQMMHVVSMHHANAPELATVLNNILAGEQRRTGGQPQDLAAVTPDKATNSLIITSSQEQFVNIRKILDSLDIQRRQVFVEAIIFEIRADKAKQFGIEWRSTQNLNNTGVSVIGGTNFGNINAAAANPLAAAGQNGLMVGAVNGTISYGGTTFANIGALISALQSDTDVNIISTPTLLTTDNEDARLFVGQNVPFLSSSAQTTGGTPIVNVQRQDIGTMLRITPSISENKFVRLKIFTEISSVSPTQLAKAQDIITFKRTAETVVVVRDAQNVVLGGLIQDQSQDVENKVPLLGSIPLIGWLFKSISTQVIKTNLLIFLTPHIINTSEEMDDVTGRNMDLLGKIGGPKVEPGVKPGHGIGIPNKDSMLQTPPSPEEPKNAKPQSTPARPEVKKEEIMEPGYPSPEEPKEPEKPAPDSTPADNANGAEKQK